ncbi:PaaI family thioesterase [Cupriavidus basilensis]|uniref:PaaI family thioesterase n=1 Tax=Cupriavidus basilensis TaxID=68895 RepID=UPI0022B12B92|nr:PaaI family thioesterase [Cupriavidus basilensis]
MIVSGKIPPPPAARLLGLEVVSATRGTVELTFFADRSFLNPAGAVQGGMLSAMLDEALSIAALTALDQGEHVLTLEMKVQFIAAARDGQLRAQGRLISQGGRVGFVEADLTQEGKLIARSTATLLVRSSDK